MSKNVDNARKIIKEPMMRERERIKTRIDDKKEQIRENSEDEQWLILDISRKIEFLKKYSDDYDYRNAEVSEELMEKYAELSSVQQRKTRLDEEQRDLANNLAQIQNKIDDVNRLSEDATFKQAYNLLCDKKKAAQDIEAFKYLEKAFRLLTGYRDADELAGDCNKKIQQYHQKRLDDNNKSLKEAILRMSECKTESDYNKIKENLTVVLKEFDEISTNFDVQQLIDDTKKIMKDCDSAIERCRMQIRFDKNKKQLSEAVSKMSNCVTIRDYYNLKTDFANILSEFNAIAADFDVEQSVLDIKKRLADCDKEIDICRQKEEKEQHTRKAWGRLSLAVSALFIVFAFFDWINVVGGSEYAQQFLFDYAGVVGNKIGIGIPEFARGVYNAFQSGSDKSVLPTAIVLLILMVLPVIINFKHCVDILNKYYINGSKGAAWCGILIATFILFESYAKISGSAVALTIIPWILLALSVLNSIICENNRREKTAFKTMLVVIAALLGFGGYKGWLTMPDLSIHSGVFRSSAITQDTNVTPEPIQLPEEATVEDSSTPTLPIFPGELSKGSKGDNVRLIQDYLNIIGEHNEDSPQLVVDGDFGPKTEAAVKDFQERIGLTVDGIVDEDTWDAIIAKGYSK